MTMVSLVQAQFSPKGLSMALGLKRGGARGAAVALAASSLLSVGLFATGCTKPEPQEPPAPPPAPAVPEYITIVSSLPRLGPDTVQAASIANGIRLAVDEAGGKAGNLQVRYEEWDNSSAARQNWEPEAEKQNATKAVGDATVVAYIGPYNSGAAEVSMPILNQAGLAMVSPTASYSGLTKPGKGKADEPMKYRPSGKVNFFRVVPSDEIQGALAAEWMASMGGKTVYVFDDGDVYGKGIADEFVAGFSATGKVLGRDTVTADAATYGEMAKKAKGSKADWVFVGATLASGAGALVKAMLDADVKAKFMLPDAAYNTALIDAVGAVGNDRVYVTFSGVPPTKMTGAGAEFVKKYAERYKADPEAYAVFGYVAAKAVLEAVATGGRDREAVRAALAKTRQENGPLGFWYFDENGDTTMRLGSGNALKGGKFEFVDYLGVLKASE